MAMLRGEMFVFKVRRRNGLVWGIKGLYGRETGLKQQQEKWKLKSRDQESSGELGNLGTEEED